MSTGYQLALGTTVGEQIDRERSLWRLAYVSILLLGALLGLLAWRRGPGTMSIALAVLIFLLVAWAVRPLLALHMTLLFTLVGDSVTAPWYPMVKNFSSHESILFVGNALTISPIDVTLGFALACLLLQRIAFRVPLVKGPLFRPLMVFTGFVMFGALYGTARGGDTRVAVFEVRPFFYLAIFYVLASNYCRTAAHFRRLLWTAMGAVLLNSLLSLNFFFHLNHDSKASLESLGEHGAAVGMNTLLILFIGSCVFRGSSVRSRWILAFMVLPVGWVYVLSNRRAAVVGLLAGIAFLSVIVFWRQPRTFFKFVPVMSVVVIAYLGAFWNSTSAAGFPAQAVKSVISPNTLSKRDLSSDLYRQIENNDLNFTIRQTKVFGVGFGNTFYQPFQLPDLGTTFAFRNYIPHNSVLWIWLQTGFLGFVSMLFMLGRGLMVGASKLRQVREGPDVVVLSTAAIFIAMYSVFAYVDIAWDARNMLLLGVALALCANFPVPARAPASVDHDVDEFSFDPPQLAPADGGGAGS